MCVRVREKESTMYACMRVCVKESTVYACMRVCVCVCGPICIFVIMIHSLSYIKTHTHTHTHTHIHVCMYMKMILLSASVLARQAPQSASTVRVASSHPPVRRSALQLPQANVVSGEFCRAPTAAAPFRKTQAACWTVQAPAPPKAVPCGSTTGALRQ